MKKKLKTKIRKKLRIMAAISGSWRLYADQKREGRTVDFNEIEIRRIFFAEFVENCKVCRMQEQHQAAWHPIISFVEPEVGK